MRDLNAFLRVSDKWDREYCTALSSAIIQRKGLKHGSRLINKYLSRERRLDFNLVNPHSRRIMRRELLIAASALERRLYRPGTVVMLASFVDRDWACCDRSITFDLHAAKQKVRNALAGMNYIAVFEPAVGRGIRSFNILDQGAGSCETAHTMDQPHRVLNRVRARRRSDRFERSRQFFASTRGHRHHSSEISRRWASVSPTMYRSVVCSDRCPASSCTSRSDPPAR
jgi:hypothetical protein